MRSLSPLSCGLAAGCSGAQHPASTATPKAATSRPRRAIQTVRHCRSGSHPARRNRENPCQYGRNASGGHRCDLHREEIAAGGVGQRERVAARAIGGAQPALKIHRPVRNRSIRKRMKLALPRRPACALARVDEPSPLQDIADGRSRRPGGVWMMRNQQAADFLRPEEFAPLARRDDDGRDRLRRRVRPAQGAMAAVFKPARIPALAPRLRKIKRLATDPKLIAQPRHRQNAAVPKAKQPNTLFHRVAFPDRHGHTSQEQGVKNDCQGSTRSKLSAISPVWTFRLHALMLYPKRHPRTPRPLRLRPSQSMLAKRRPLFRTMRALQPPTGNLWRFRRKKTGGPKRQRAPLTLKACITDKKGRGPPVRGRRRYNAKEIPPSTTIVWPVTNPASGDASHKAAPAMSSGVPQRPSGVAATEPS